MTEDPEREVEEEEAEPEVEELPAAEAEAEAEHRARGRDRGAARPGGRGGARRGRRARRRRAGGRARSRRPRSRTSSRWRRSRRSTSSWTTTRTRAKRSPARLSGPASRLAGSMGSPGTPDQPLRVAIVGSGPSGFYAAGHLLKCKSHPDLNVQVDVYDRLPTPWGLVRGGVAPDHPNIKAVSRVYEKTAAHPEFRFFGNVEYGRDLTHDDLHARYHAVIYAVGAQTDRRMGIPGEDLPGSWAATEFVAWYNGHPDYRELEFDLSCERAVVVGNGNVAADVARMLALTRDELAADRRRRPRPRGARRKPHRGDRRARPPRPRPGRVHEPRAAGARRDDRRRRVRRPARRRDGRGSAAPGWRARPPARPRARTSRS